MTKHQAILKMMEGEKVTHELFHDGEYLFMKGDFGIIFVYNKHRKT